MTYNDGLSQPLRQYDPGNPINLPQDCLTHIFGYAKVRGNDPDDAVCEAVPLQLALTNIWASDAHFTMYHSPANVRCTKSGGPYDLTFSFCAFDLDFGGHKTRPTVDDFHDVMRTAAVLDEVPNVVYATRGGCRWIYLIEHMHDAEEFEQHYQSLLAKLDVALVKCTSHSYRVDTAAKDWTRLFRLPWVNRSGEIESHYLVRVLHDNVMDLRTFKPKVKPERKPVTPGKVFMGYDHKLERMLRSRFAYHDRNCSLFDVCCYLLENYSAEAVEIQMETVRATAYSSGLDDKEIDDTFKSATNFLARKRGANA